MEFEKKKTIKFAGIGREEGDQVRQPQFAAGKRKRKRKKKNTSRGT